MTAESVDIQAVINAAIEQSVREHEGGFTLRWVALIESSNAEGERGLWTMASPGLKPWDTLGLIEFAKLMESRKLINGTIE